MEPPVGCRQRLTSPTSASSPRTSATGGAWIFDSAPSGRIPFVHLAFAADADGADRPRHRRPGSCARSVMTMASGIATIARLSGGGCHACFGTGFTARLAMGQPPMTLDALFAYVAALRRLLAGETALIDGKAARMMQWPGLTAARPIAVPLWLSVFGPRGNGGRPRWLPAPSGRRTRHFPPQRWSPARCSIRRGTRVEPGARGGRAVAGHRMAHGSTKRGLGRGRHHAGRTGGRDQLDALAPEDERHLLTFEGQTPTSPNVTTRSLRHRRQGDGGDTDSIRRKLDRLAHAGFCEVMCTPAGPTSGRELRTFAAAHHAG